MYASLNIYYCRYNINNTYLPDENILLNMNKLRQERSISQKVLEGHLYTCDDISLSHVTKKSTYLFLKTVR